MADSKTPAHAKNATADQAQGEVSGADDGGSSRLTNGYKDNPDKPDPSSIAQVEELKDEAAATS